MKKQMIIDFEDRLPQVSDLECGYLYKALTGGLRMIKIWTPCTKLLTVVIKSLFGVKDAYLQKVGINEKHVHCCTCSVLAKNKVFQP